MDAPKCRTCGERHWQRICPKYAGKPVKSPRLQAVTVVTPDPVTPVTPRNTVTPCPECKRWASEVAMLTAEVKELKRQLAKHSGSESSAAKRMRAYRERLRIQKQ